MDRFRDLAFDGEHSMQPELGPIPPFSLPVTYWDEDGKYIFKRYKLSLSAGEIQDALHRSKTSATAYVNALINKAFQDTFKTGFSLSVNK